MISADIIRDGVRYIRSAAQDLINRRPQRLIDLDLDPIPECLTDRPKALDWVEDAFVRVREDGNFFVVDAFVIPREEGGLVERIEAAQRDACASDWRLREVMVMPVRELPRLDEGNS